jgi:peptide/nickel transport system ATP-binding protein
MIYQDPYESLDVRFRVRDTVAEPLRIHGIGGSEGQRAALVNKALERVGLTPVEDFLMRFPHELSGGQRQRVAIAASIILRPALLLADEPVSMLDISLRTGILELLNTLRRDGQMGVLMITHDLSTAAHYADRIAVMHNGCIVEVGTAAAVIQAPRADYTRALIASIPNPDPDVRRARPA